jgi:hypothetical protein
MVSKSKRKLMDMSIKRTKSMHHPAEETPLDMNIKRNPKVRYVKAEVFRKHEKIREQLFEDKIWELAAPNKLNIIKEHKHSYFDSADPFFQRNLLENSKGIESLEESDDEEMPQDAGEFIIAQNYGSFDDGDNLDSAYSDMKGDSLPGDFDLQIVGSKIDIPKNFSEANFCEKSINASQMGSKITFGEPSGEVFGLTFANQCDGIFQNDCDNEF